MIIDLTTLGPKLKALKGFRESVLVLIKDKELILTAVNRAGTAIIEHKVKVEHDDMNPFELSTEELNKVCSIFKGEIEMTINKAEVLIKDASKNVNIRILEPEMQQKNISISWDNKITLTKQMLDDLKSVLDFGTDKIKFEFTKEGVILSTDTWNNPSKLTIYIQVPLIEEGVCKIVTSLLKNELGQFKEGAVMELRNNSPLIIRDEVTTFVAAPLVDTE